MRQCAIAFVSRSAECRDPGISSARHSGVDPDQVAASAASFDLADPSVN
jgi:hypothetical protein